MFYTFIMKKSLRKKYLLLRKDVSGREEKDSIIYDKVISNDKVTLADTILIYVSLDDEVDTRKLINYFLAYGKKVAVCKVLGKEMNFYYINSFDDLALGYKNILEPKEYCIEVSDFSSSISITPGICFNRVGYRIGYGGGYYDRFYDKVSLYKIGLCYKEFLIDDAFNDIYDVAVDEIITDYTLK